MSLRTVAAAGLAGVMALFPFSLPVTAILQERTSQTALPDVRTLGPQVGTRVPDFTLSDQQGQPRTLASLIGPKGLMLVFFRSADW